MTKMFGTVIFSALPFISQPQTLLALSNSWKKGEQKVKADKNTHREANHVQQMQHQEHAQYGGQRAAFLP